jgi:hypothetical protein
MTDMQPFEIEAALYGGQMGGEYLESIGVTDLKTLSSEQWRTFLVTVTSNYHAEHNRLKPCPF